MQFCPSAYGHWAVVLCLGGSLLAACGEPSGNVPSEELVDSSSPATRGDAGVDAGGADAAARSSDGDAAAQADPDAAATECVPLGCAEQGFECGVADDGCGGALDCEGVKVCEGLDFCGGVEPNRCGCPVVTCESLSAESGHQACGVVEMGCGMGQVDCGPSCPPGESCGAVEPNVCGCVPDLAACGDKTCGSVPDGCGGSVACGSCPEGGTCSPEQQCLCAGERCERSDDDPCPGCDAATRALLGRYVMRNVSFAVSSLSPGSAGRNESISILEIRLNAARELELVEEPCEVNAYSEVSRGESDQGGIPLSRARNLEPPVRSVVVEGDRFRIPSVQTAIGWRREVPYCKPGSSSPDSSAPGYANATKGAGARKPWLDNRECECVESAEQPSAPQDCRIVDEDQDSRPGLTFSSSFGDAYMASVTDVEMWGTVDLDSRRHQGTSMDGPESSQRAFQCTNLLLLTCGDVGKDTRFCPDTYNTVDFLPLDVLDRSLGREAACEDIVENPSNSAAVGLSGAGGIEQTRGRSYPPASECTL